MLTVGNPVPIIQLSVFPYDNKIPVLSVFQVSQGIGGLSDR